MKARIQKQIDKIVSMIKVIEGYNEYIESNDYCTGYGGSGRNLSFDVKLHNIWFKDGDIEDYLNELNLLPGKYRKRIIKEFDDARMEGICNHFIENSQEQFIDEAGDRNSIGEDYYGLKYLVDKEDMGFYGRGGGHLCLGDLNGFLLEIGDTELGNYPIWDYKSGEGTFYNFNKPIEELIASFKEYFHVTTQKDILLKLKEDSEDRSDLKSYYDRAIENQAIFEGLEQHIKEFKKNANECCHDSLYYEIDIFIENNFSQKMAIELAEAGDYSKLDSIKAITDTEVITSRNARVPVDKAKKLLRAVCMGLKVKGQKIGAYTVNKVKVKPNDTYIKIGCHLFSIKQTQLQLTA